MEVSDMAEAVRPVLRNVPDELIGDRVIVRPYRPGDGAQLWEAVDESREHLLPWLPWGDTHKSPTDSEEFARKMEAKWLLREDMPAGIWERATGRYLGGTGLHRIDWEVPSFEIGYWLRKSAVGHGYMTEAVRLLCTMAFETLGANRVHIQAAVGNHRSAAIPARLGFIHESTQRNAKRITTGELVDMMVFAMTPAEYRQAFQ
jgi:RimJ/RimL family protein N-acetyltransferase